MFTQLPVFGGSPFGLGDELVKLLRRQVGVLQKLAQDEHLNAERDVWGDLVGQLGFTESSADQPFRRPPQRSIFGRGDAVGAVGVSACERLAAVVTKCSKTRLHSLA